MAKENYHIFGSGIRTEENLEKGHKYNNLIVHSVRGPLTRQFLLNKKIEVPEIYGDPAFFILYFFNNTSNNKRIISFSIFIRRKISFCHI